MAITMTSTGIVYSDSSTDTTSPKDTGDLISVTSYTTAGTYTYTIPTDCTTVMVQVLGGGGGSAGYCESGGAGGFAEGMFNIAAGTAVTVTVGGGGGGVTYYAVATTGTTSSFGSYITAAGGGGANSTIAHGGGAGGVGSGGQVNLYGGTGTGHCNAGSHNQTGYGGHSFFGGSGSITRHAPTTSTIFSSAPGAGAPGNEGSGGTVGNTASAGLVMIYAYR